MLSTTRAPPPGGPAHRGADDRARHLELHEEHVARSEPVDGGHLALVEQVVGAGDDDDRVLAVVGHGDERVPVGAPSQTRTPVDVDAQPLEPAPVCRAPGVVADAPDHGDVRAPAAAAATAWLAALAAGDLPEALTEHRLAGPRVPLHPGHEVDVERPEHEDPPGHAASPRMVRTQRSAIRGPSSSRATSTIDGREPVRVVVEVAAQSRRSTTVRPRVHDAGELDAHRQPLGAHGIRLEEDADRPRVADRRAGVGEPAVVEGDEAGGQPGRRGVDLARAATCTSVTSGS